METVIDRMKRIDSQSAIPSKAVAGAGKPDEREQAIVDRHVSKAPGVSVLQRAARIDAKAEIDTRKQQRAYAEKPPTTIAQITVDPAREMVANLGDRAKVLDTIRKMSPEQREEALKLAPGIAQQLGDDRGGAVGRTLGAVSRGISHGVSQPIQELIGLGGTPDEIEYIRQLDAAASQEFAPARPGDPWYQSGPLQAAQMAPWMATVVGGAGIGRQGATALAGRIAAKGAAGGKIAGAVTQAGKVVGKTGLTAGKAGELAGTAYAAFPSQYAQEVDQLKALGMQDGTNLRLLAGGTAAIGGLIEGIVPNPFKAGNVPLTEGALKAARQYLFNAAKQAPGEMTEEYLQGVTSGLGEHVAQYIDSTAEDKSIGDAFRKGWEQTKEAALPMAFLLGVPAIGGAGLSAARARLTRLKEIRAKGPVSRTAGRELGINDEKQEDRTAKADAEIQQLEQEAAPPSVTPEVQGMLDQLKQTVPPKEESAPTVSTAGEVPLVRADQTASGQQPPALPPGTQRATPWYDFGTGEPTGPVPAPPGLGLIDRLRGRSAQGTPPVSPPASLQERMDAIVAEGKAARQRGDNTDALKAEFYRLQAELNKTQPAPPALPQQSVATQTTPPALPGTQPPALPKGRKPQPPLPKGAPDASQVPTNEGSNDVQRNGGKGSQVDSGSQVRVEGQDQGGAKHTSEVTTAPQVQVEPPKPQADEPPLAEGMTRLYHGSATPGRTEGKAWFSTHRPYAESYRGKETSELQYVDVPTERVNKAIDPDNYGQTVDKGFTWNVELDSSETGPRKTIAKPPETPAPQQAESPKAQEVQVDPATKAFVEAREAGEYYQPKSPQTNEDIANDVEYFREAFNDAVAKGVQATPFVAPGTKRQAFYEELAKEAGGTLRWTEVGKDQLTGEFISGRQELIAKRDALLAESDETLDLNRFAELDEEIKALSKKIEGLSPPPAPKQPETTTAPSERDQAEDELAGLLESPSKPTEQPKQESKPTAPVKPKQPAKTDWKLSDRVLIPEGSSGNPKAPRMVGAIVAGSISSDSVTVAIDGGGQVRLKKEELQIPDATFEVGEQVAVPWVKGVDDAPAKIMGVLPDGRYDVQFASGRRSPTRGDQMIKLAPSTTGSSEEVGTKPTGPTETPKAQAEAPETQPESKWQAETRSKLEAVPALKGAKVEADEKTGTVKVTRPDGLATTIQFNADEELAAAAKERGRNPESIHGWYIRKPGEKQGRILVHSKANHANILNHEVMHWLEDTGVVTKEEVEQYGGREEIASKYGKWAELKQRKKDSVFQRIYDALEPVFSSQARFFEEVGARKAAKPQEDLSQDKKPSVPEPTGEKDKARIAEIDKELERLQAQYEKKSKQQSKSAMVPPSIKADALSQITKKMDILDAEKKALQSEKPSPEPTGEQDTGTSRGQSGEQVGNKGAKEQARENLRRRGKKKPSQADLDAETAAVIREREADNKVRQEFQADRDAQKAQDARREFVGKQKALANPATVDSLGFGDIAQVNDDIERGRVSYDDAIKVADAFVEAGYLPQLRRDQIRKPAEKAVAEPIEASVANEEDELASLYAQSEKMYNEVELLQNAGKDREANALIREAEKLAPRIKELEAPRIKAKQDADATAEEERRKRYNEKEDARKAALPTKQTRNGWELATDSVRWYLRDPNTKEIIYEGKLTRVREVADEAPPDAPTNEVAEAEARAERDAKLRERLKTLDYDNLRKLNKDAVIQVGDEVISDIGGLALEELSRRMDEAEAVLKKAPHVAALRAALGDDYANRHGADFDRYFNEFDSLDEDAKNREYRSNERRGKSFQSELGAKVTYAGAIVGLTEDGMRRVMDAMKQGAKAEKPYPERPHGETGDELIKRIAGREWHEVTKADFLRWAAGEYIAGGARKDKLVDDYKLGTEEQRRAFHEKTVANAIKEGKYVPPEVLADYQKTAPDEQSQGMVEVIQIFKNAVRFSVDSDIPPSVPQKRSTRTDGVEYIEVTNPYLDRIPNVKEAIALRKQQASEATSSEQEVQSYKRGDIVSAFGRDEAKVLIPDLGDLSYKKGNVRIEMTSGANKGKTMDVEPSDIRPLAEEDTIAGKAAKEASDKAAAKRVADEKIYNDMRDELLPLIRRIKKSGVTLNPKTKKAKKELVDKVMMGTQNRNEKMIQEAIDIVAAEKAEESVNEVPKRKGKRLGLGDTFTDSKTGKQFTIDEVIHKNWGLSTVSEYKSALINLNDGGWVYEIGNRKVILEKMVLAGIGDESTPEQEPQKQEENEPEPVPVQADFMEMSNGVNAPGVKQTIRVTAGERTLLMERSKHDSEWSIKEADEYTGEVKGKTPVRTKGETFVSGIAETKKAKEIAQRIIDGTFDKDADSRFVREDTQNIGLTNTGLADSMKDSLQRRDSFAKLLREEGLFTDGRLLLKVNEKDRDAILKRVGETDEGRPLGVVAQMLSDGRKALSRSANAMKPIGYRGGELTTRTVVLQSQDGDAAILDKALHDTILKKYPDAIPYFLDDGKPVSYVSNDDVVAIVMPMNMDKPDAKVKELIAGKYDFEAEAAEAAKFPPPAPKTKLKQAAEKANEELAKAVDEFGNVLKGKLGTNLPLNPEVIAAAAKVVAKAIQAGTLNFAELMERMVTKYGEKMAERMRGALQQEWDKQVNSNPIAEDGIPPKAPQPHPELVQPEPIPLTSVKNAIVDELRIQRGEAPMPEVTPETVQQWLELAGNRIANDPYAGNTLVEQLLSGGKTSVDEMEGMVLQYHYRAVNNLFTAADAKLTEAKANGDPAEIAIAQDEARVIMRRLAAIETALDKAGTAWGRAGVSRQIFLKQDFSLGAMVRRARVANGGNELSDKQVAIISEQADRIEKLQKQLAELEAKVEASAEQEQAKVIDDAIKNDIEDTKKPTAAKPKSKMRIKAEERLAFAWEKFGAVAKGKLYSNPIDPELLAPALEVVKAYLDLGIVTFREFMSTAAQNMGAKAAKASETTFRAAWDQLKEEGELAQPALDITNVGQLTRFARNVQRTLVENGITEREEVVDSVHEALQEIVPEITRRQTMDALSSYGQFAQLSKDPIDQIIRDINGQLQQLAKLEDMEKGQAPAKTGVERRSPTDEERRLTQLVNEAKRRGGFVVTDPETQLKSAMAAAKTAVKNRIADMNYEIKTGSRVVRNKTELIPDAELEQLRKDRDELQKVHKEMFPPKGATQAQKIASASRALDAAIANLEAKLAVGDISPAPQPAPLSTPELDAKRARLKELHEQRDALRKIAKPNMTAEQIKIRSLDKSIEALEKQLAAGNFAPKPKPTPLTSPEIDARQAKLEELRATKKAILDAANPKMTPEQRASRAYEAHLRKQLAMYLEKIAQGDFAPKQKKPPRVLTQGELALKKQLADVKHDFFEALSKYHLDNLSPGGRAIDIVRESAHLSRAIMTSIDLSAVLRQGGLGVYSHPVMARKAAGEMWHSIWSREKEFQSMEKLRTRPNAQLYEESGLNITDSEGKLTRQEEAFMGRWARTGIDFAGSKVQTASKLALEPVAASARAYVTFINNLRADLFDVMVDNLGPGGQVTPEEAKVIASYINVATGRSDLKSLNEKAATLNTVFFAPRYVASRFQYLAMPFYLMGTKDSGRVKKLIAKEYARTFAGAAVFIGSLTALAYLAAGGDDEEKPSVEFNPLSSDFGKVRIDETRLDPLAGLAQVIVFSSRMLSFHTKSSITGKIKPFYEGGPYETTHGSEAWRFLRTKFAPVPGAVVTAFSGMKDVVGDPVTPAGLIGGLFVPISVGEVLSTMKHRGIPKGLALNVLNLMGAAVNTYGPKTAYLDATPEERAKQVNDYIKYMNWESDLPAFSQYLKPEDLKRVQNRQDERRGDLVFEALDEVKPKNEYKTEVHYEEAVERHEKLNKEFEDFRKQYAPTFADAVRYLGHHFDDEGGIKIKGTGKKKPSYKERYKALLLRYQ